LISGLTVATMKSNRYVAHLDTAMQGMTMFDPKLAAEALTLFENLRSESLPQPGSSELIAEAGSKGREL
jgi:hypothetical protein